MKVFSFRKVISDNMVCKICRRKIQLWAGGRGVRRGVGETTDSLLEIDFYKSETLKSSMNQGRNKVLYTVKQTFSLEANNLTDKGSL